MITTENLLIKETSNDDILNYFSLVSNEKIMYYNPSSYTKDIDVLYKLKDDNKHKLYSIYNKNNNEYIAQINYEIISTLNEYKLCDLNIIYDSDKYIKEAINSLLELMIIHDSCIKIVSNVLEDDVLKNRILSECRFVLDKKIDANFNLENTHINVYKITKPIYLKK